MLKPGPKPVLKSSNSALDILRLTHLAAREPKQFSRERVNIPGLRG